MSALWNYRGISLEIEATLIHEGHRCIVPTYVGESWDHAFLKILVAAHLLSWGYPWEKIHWEQVPPDGPGNFRPDIYTEGQGDLPPFWFECGWTEDEKLRSVVATLPDFRVVHVMNAERFRSWWNGERPVLINGEFIDTSQVKDKRELKRLVLQHRQEATVPGVEYWGVRETSRFVRIVFAVRRELDGTFTYMDTEESWSISHIKYFSKHKDRLQPLIPRVVGSDQWEGESAS